MGHCIRLRSSPALYQTQRAVHRHCGETAGLHRIVPAGPLGPARLLEACAKPYERQRNPAGGGVCRKTFENSWPFGLGSAGSKAQNHCMARGFSMASLAVLLAQGSQEIFKKVAHSQFFRQPKGRSGRRAPVSCLCARVAMFLFRFNAIFLPRLLWAASGPFFGASHCGKRL